MRHDIEIRTEDGIAKAAIFRADSAAAATAGIIIYMDAFGPRPVLDRMAERLAGQGYAVLVPDLFYRSGAYGPFDPRTAFADDKTRGELMALIGATTQDMTRRDGAAFLDALSANGVTGPVGTVAYPDRIAAAASIHGGNLAADAPDSPYANASSIKARVYVGTAGVDRSFPPEQSARLAEAFRTAEIDHIIENYVGMQHGWTVPDHSVYDEAGAERHWKRLTVFFGEALG